MLLERNNRYQHIICNILLDKNTQAKVSDPFSEPGSKTKIDPQLQSFCRSEALTILENCTDFWNGNAVVPFTDKARTTIKELMQHWNSENFDPIGYSYKPVTPDVSKMISAHLHDGQAFDKELAKSQIEK